MLCSVVYTEAHPRRSAAFASRMNLRDAAHSAPSGSNGTPFISFNFIPLRTLFLATDGYTPLPLANCRTRVTYSFRINTCKSVSKQKTLTPFRMNTYEKQGEGGSMVFLARMREWRDETRRYKIEGRAARSSCESGVKPCLRRGRAPHQNKPLPNPKE